MYLVDTRVISVKFKNIVHSLTKAGPYRHGLFYNFPGGLRFELSEGGCPLDQVLTALRKATVVCGDIFGEQDFILVHLQRYVSSSRFELRKTIRELHLAGVVVPRERDIWCDESGMDDDDDDDGLWLNCAFEVQTSKLQNLLWCAFATDFGPMRPNPHCLVYLIEAAQGIIVHPYDDRGMDVICETPFALQALYERHNGWLLDHDREAINKTFIPALNRR